MLVRNLLGLIILFVFSVAKAKEHCSSYLTHSLDINFSVEKSKYTPIGIKPAGPILRGEYGLKYDEEYEKSQVKLTNFLAEFIEELMIVKKGHSAKKVLYPAVGTDAVFAFEVFPSADLVIGLDSHPFISDRGIEKDHRSVDLLPVSKRRGAFESYGSVLKVNGQRYDAAQIILTDLIRRYPNIVVEEVKLIHTRSELSAVDKAISGEIIFRTEVGGPLKKYIHLQLPLNNGDYSFNDLGFLGIANLIIKTRFDVVISKGSMNFFNPFNQKIKIPTLKKMIEKFDGKVSEFEIEYPGERERVENILKTSIPFSVGVEIIKSLALNNGVFVNMDGNHQLDDKEFRFSDGSSLTFEVHTLGLQSNYPFHNETEIKFGYSKARNIEVISLFKDSALK